MKNSWGQERSQRMASAWKAESEDMWGRGCISFCAGVVSKAELFCGIFWCFDLNFCLKYFTWSNKRTMPRRWHATRTQILQCRVRRSFLQSHLRLGLLALTEGPAKAATTFGESIQVARYWMRRVSDPTFHCGTWGGQRYFVAIPFLYYILIQY